MLRVAFLLTGLIFVPLGLYLYFLPPGVAALLGISPLWLARVSGGVILAWGLSTLAGSSNPDLLRTGSLVGGNLLAVAALLPLLLSAGSTLPGGVRSVLLAVTVLLAVLAAVALVSFPSRRRRL